MQEPHTDTERGAWSRRYAAAMRRFLRPGQPAELPAATKLGRQAAALGLEALDVALVHEQALTTLTPPEDAPGNAGQKLLERADTFFKETIVPIEATHHAARMTESRIGRLTRTLQQRTGQSSASAEELQRAIVQRQAVEANTREREAQHKELLAEAQRVQKRLRQRMRDILSKQEGAWQRIGGDLRDEIAQALVAIDLGLLALKTAGHVNTETTEKSIANAQRILKEFRTRRALADAG
jgi:signal transduction histidine kinase